MRILILILLLSGCSAKFTVHRDADGIITRFEANRSGTYTYKRGDEEVTLDTKRGSPLDGLINVGPKIGG